MALPNFPTACSGIYGSLPYPTINSMTCSGSIPYPPTIGSGSIFTGLNSIVPNNTIQFTLGDEVVLIVRKDEEKNIVIEWPKGKKIKLSNEVELAIQETLNELGLKAMLPVVMTKVSRKLDDTICKKVTEAMRQSGYNL